eukprot:jgi/Chlat1/129/Chrsp1S03226
MAGRTHVPAEEEEDAAELKLPKLFQNARCLMNAEVNFLLSKRVEHLRDTNAESEQQIPQTLTKSLDYVKQFSAYSNKETANQVWMKLSSRELHNFEKAAIGNLAPDSVEEAKALVPSLAKKMKDNEIEAMLADLAVLKKFE